MSVAAEINLFLIYFGHIFITWWWVPLPFILLKPFLFLYRFWRIEVWLNQRKFDLLEIRLPKNIEKPMRAMETVVSSIHQVLWHPPDWWEKWVDGQVQLGFQIEIASIGGEIHIYFRTARDYREGIEAAIYSQYPEAEITEVEDYTKYVPQNIPNKDWDMFASDYKMVFDDHFPVKTYREFETEHEVTEGQKVDPIAALMEALSKVVPGGQFWIQISAEPVSEQFLTPWLDKGKELRDKLARRPDPPGAPKPILHEAAQILITGRPSEAQKVEEKDIIPPEMKLTPGEREVIQKVEEKMSKPIFKTGIRFITMGKRDSWYKNFRLAFAFFNSFTTLHLNQIQLDGRTLTKIHKHWFLPWNMLKPRRHYLRCRREFRNYTRRVNAFFPREGGTFMMNSEELASIFHFPSQGISPGAATVRVEAKKGAVPADLPVDLE